MNGRMRAFALAVLATGAVASGTAAGGTVSTPIQTQSIATTPVGGGPGMPELGSPLSFTQFDPRLGTLDGVAITFSATIDNVFTLNFDNTPLPTTLYVATTEAADPSVLTDPSRAAQLTDGPSIALGGPVGSTLFGGPATTMPVDVVSFTSSSASSYSSSDPINSPYYIAPDDATIQLAQTFNASSILGAFTGTGTIGLPVTAVAHSSFYSDSGNGGGSVITRADATVTVQYLYTPFTSGQSSVPEPSGLVLLAVGAGLGLAAIARRPREGRAGARP